MIEIQTSQLDCHSYQLQLLTCSISNYGVFCIASSLPTIVGYLPCSIVHHKYSIIIIIFLKQQCSLFTLLCPRMEDLIASLGQEMALLTAKLSSSKNNSVSLSVKLELLK